MWSWWVWRQDRCRAREWRQMRMASSNSGALGCTTSCRDGCAGEECLPMQPPPPKVHPLPPVLPAANRMDKNILLADLAERGSHAQIRLSKRKRTSTPSRPEARDVSTFKRQRRVRLQAASHGCRRRCRMASKKVAVACSMQLRDRQGSVVARSQVGVTCHEATQPTRSCHWKG